MHIPSPPLTQRVYLALRRIDRHEILNDGAPADMPSGDLAARLRLAINQLKGEGIDPERGTVDYRGLAAAPAYAEYRAAAQMLARFDLTTLKDMNERKAFWINLYNALIIDAVIAYGAQRSITEIPAVFDRAAYVVGGFRFSANEIEHGILRANAGHPFIPGAQFRRGDPRLAFAVDHIDSRLHFALVCAAKSCPPIGFYVSKRIDSQLDLAARHFAGSGNVLLDRGTMTVQLSQIFSWYAADFGGGWYGWRHRDRLLRAVAGFLPLSADREFIEANAARLRVRFSPYDWDLNDDGDDGTT